jgi:VanZ family protein
MSLINRVQRTLTTTPRGRSHPAVLVWQWAPLLLWMLIIFVLSHQPGDNIPSAGDWDFVVKKGGHFAGYALFWFLAHRAGFSPWAAFALSVAFSIGDELHQTSIPSRDGRPLDVFIDSAGALTALALTARLRR